jgi:glutamine phosphoribosylpyrophosphate amidotransferase
VKVGGMVSLNSHDTNIVIYSEDTSIAVAEGLLVKGVSPGTVYVVSVDKDWHHTTAAYLIIVE